MSDEIEAVPEIHNAPAQPNAAVVYSKAELKVRCYELRLQCKSLRDISEELGISPATAMRYVEAEIERRSASKDHDIKRQQRLVADRLDFLIRQIWPRIEQGDVQAVAQVVKIEERRCKLLGLDEPMRIQANVVLDNMPDSELMDIACRLGLELTLSAVQAARSLASGPNDTELLPGEFPNALPTHQPVSDGQEVIDAGCAKSAPACPVAEQPGSRGIP